MFVRQNAPDLYTRAFGDPAITSLRLLLGVFDTLIPHVQASPKLFERDKLNQLSDNAEKTLQLIDSVYDPSLLSSSNKQIIDEHIADVTNKIRLLRNAAQKARSGFLGSSSSSSYAARSSNDGCLGTLAVWVVIGIIAIVVMSNL